MNKPNNSNQPEPQPAAPVVTPAALPAEPAKPADLNAPAEPSTSGQIISKEIEETLNFDPFSEVEKVMEGDPSAPASEPTPAIGEPEPAPVTAQPQAEPASADAPKVEPVAEPTSAPAATPSPQPAPVSPEVVLLQAELASLKNTLATIQASAAPAPASPKPEGQEETPAYNYNVPDALVASLQSEDPNQFKQGLASLMQGVSQTVHQTLNSQIEVLVNERVPLMINQAIGRQDTARNMQDSFYATNPDLTNPNMRPIIVAAAKQVQQRTGVTQWSNEFGALVAQEARQMIQNLGLTQNQPAVTPVPVAPVAPIIAAPAPAPIIAGGTRAAPGVPATGMEREVAEMLFG